MNITSRQRLILGVAIVAVLAIWVVVANLYESSSTAILSVSTGNCFELPEDDGNSIERVETPDCAEPHDAQVFYRFEPDQEMTADAKVAMCIEKGGTNILVDLLSDDAEINFLDIDVGRSSFTSRTLCYIWHPQMVTGSYVVTDPIEGD